MFDARVFTIADPAEVAGYFIWRQRDAVRNSISMAARAVFPHRQLDGVHSGQAQEMLFAERGINWNDYPAGCKRGRVVVKASGERAVTFVHKRTGVQETVTALRSWWRFGRRRTSRRTRTGSWPGRSRRCRRWPPEKGV